MQMNGIAHIGITVSNFKKCNPFYRQLFAFLEMQLIYDSDEVIYGVGGRTGIAVKEAEAKFQSEVFEQNRVGLHHFCFRARTRSDIDDLYEFSCGYKCKDYPSPGRGRLGCGLLFDSI